MLRYAYAAIFGICAHTIIFAQTWTITSLGSLGGSYTEVWDINENGQVVGTSRISPGGAQHAFLWQQSDGMSDLGHLGGGFSIAYGINDLGEVAGVSDVTFLTSRAFLYSEGSIADIGTLPGTYTDSWAWDINNAGHVVGFAYYWQDDGQGGAYSTDNTAFLYDGNTVISLGTLGGSESTASNINNAGQITGDSYTASGEYHAFRYENASMQDLGTLGGNYSNAESINEFGHVVGSSATSNDFTHAFLHDGTAMIDLGVLSGFLESWAYDINDLGQIVGNCSGGGNPSAPFLFHNGSMMNLNDLVIGSGWILSGATAINNAGQIVGYGMFNGETQAFLLTPQIIPEPSIWALAVAGGILLVTFSMALKIAGSCARTHVISSFFSQRCIPFSCRRISLHRTRTLQERVGKKVVIFLVLPILLIAESASAVLVSLEANGIISSNDTGDPLFAPGTQWAIEIIYDSDAMDLNPDSNIGTYDNATYYNNAMPPALRFVTLSIGGASVEFDPVEELGTSGISVQFSPNFHYLEFTINNVFPNTFGNGISLASFSLSLTDLTGTALQGDALPLDTSLNLTNFEAPHFFMLTDSGLVNVIGSDVLDVTFVLVPEPSVGLLIVVGACLFMMIFIRNCSFDTMKFCLSRWTHLGR